MSDPPRRPRESEQDARLRAHAAWSAPRATVGRDFVRCGFWLEEEALVRVLVIQKGTRVLIWLWDSLMVGRVPKNAEAGAGLRPVPLFAFGFGVFAFWCGGGELPSLLTAEGPVTKRPHQHSC